MHSLAHEQEEMRLEQWQKDRILDHRRAYIGGLAQIAKERKDVEQGLKVSICLLWEKPL